MYNIVIQCYVINFANLCNNIVDDILYESSLKLLCRHENNLLSDIK